MTLQAKMKSGVLKVAVGVVVIMLSSAIAWAQDCLFLQRRSMGRRV